MATAENNVAAARPSKRRETSVVRVGIDSSVLLFLIARAVRYQTHATRHYSGPATARNNFTQAGAKEKAPRNEPQRLALLSLCRRSGLLDRREFPICAARPDECPHFGRFRRRFAAFDQLAGGAIDGLVDQGIAQRDTGVIGVAFTPGFREVTLQQLGVSNLVDDVPG